MSLITGLRGLEILDSRGHPMVAVEVTLACGSSGYAAAPSDMSMGSCAPRCLARTRMARPRSMRA